MSLLLVVLFGTLAAIVGGFCGAIAGLAHQEQRNPSSPIVILLLVVGLALFGKWLIASEVVTVGRLIGVFAVSFIPTALLSLFGFAKHGL